MQVQDIDPLWSISIWSTCDRLWGFLTPLLLISKMSCRGVTTPHTPVASFLKAAVLNSRNLLCSIAKAPLKIAQICATFAASVRRGITSSGFLKPAVLNVVPNFSRPMLFYPDALSGPGDRQAIVLDCCRRFPWFVMRIYDFG